MGKVLYTDGKCMEATLFLAHVGKNYRVVNWDLLIFQLYNYFIHFCFFHLPVLICSLLKAYRYINKNVNQQSQVMNDKGIKYTTHKTRHPLKRTDLLTNAKINWTNFAVLTCTARISAGHKAVGRCVT